VTQHPFEKAVFEAWCKEHGLDLDSIRKQMAGKQLVPRAFAVAARRDLGVPLSAWKLLEPEWSLRSRAEGGTFGSMESSDNGSAGEGFHVENGSKPTQPFRRGQKLVSEGPVARAVRNAGLKSRSELARALGHKPDTVKNWDRRKTAPDAVKRRLSESPYFVPLSAWAE
jgi:hypothetical protein